MTFQQPDMYYDNPPQSRSPNAQRHTHQSQTLHRQPSRQFDSFAHLPSNLYGPDDHTQQRYEPSRFANDRMNATMQPNYGGGYDMGGQTWNSNAFGGNNNLLGLGPGNRSMKPPQKGRPGIPGVSPDHICLP